MSTGVKIEKYQVQVMGTDGKFAVPDVVRSEGCEYFTWLPAAMAVARIYAESGRRSRVVTYVETTEAVCYEWDSSSIAVAVDIDEEVARA
jgi:hypothetical protein